MNTYAITLGLSIIFLVVLWFVLRYEVIQRIFMRVKKPKIAMQYDSGIKLPKRSYVDPIPHIYRDWQAEFKAAKADKGGAIGPSGGPVGPIGVQGPRGETYTRGPDGSTGPVYNGEEK